MEILDDLSEEKKQLPRINPFEPPEDSEITKKIKLFLFRGSSLFVFIVYFFVALQKEGRDWKEIIGVTLGLAVLMFIGFAVAGYILSLVLNFFIFLVGKIIIEPLKIHELSSIYQRIYIDIDLSMTFFNLMLIVALINAYFNQIY